MKPESYQQAVTEYLTKPDNLRLALEISEHMPRLKQSLQIKFWNETSAMLKDKLDGQLDYWEIDPLEGEDATKNNHGFYLRGKESKSQHIKLNFTLFQESNGGYYNVYRGIRAKEVT